MKDRQSIENLHAASSTLEDWDGTHGPGARDVSQAIANIWAAAPDIRIELLQVFTSTTDTCVAHIRVIVNSNMTLDVVDVITYDDRGKVLSRELAAPGAREPCVERALTLFVELVSVAVRAYKA